MEISHFKQNSQRVILKTDNKLLPLPGIVIFISILIAILMAFYNNQPYIVL